MGKRRLTTMIDTQAPPEASAEGVPLVQQILDALPSGVVLTDEEGRIRFLNPAAVSVLGLPAQGGAAAGIRLTDLRGEYEPMLWPTHKGEVLILDRSGAGGRVLGFTSRTIVTNDKRGTIVVFSDITDAKANAKAADHRRRLADVGTVVATLAHEIRNPVSAIGNLTSLLADEDAIGSDPDLALIVKKIRDEARRLGRLVDDTLAFARDRELALDQVDIPALFGVIFDDIRQVWAPGVAPVPMRVTVAPGLEVEARRWRLDENAGRQAFSNLVRNAVQGVLDRDDRTPRHGVEVALQQEGPALRIDIIDQGVGIPAEHLARITEPFFTSRPTGTGLGMAVAERIIAQHGGRLRIESRPGERTVVSTILPR